MLPKKGIKKEMDVLRQALNTDEGYRFSWQSNIAMAFFDEVKRSNVKISTSKLREVGNNAAINFLKLLCAETV